MGESKSQVIQPRLSEADEWNPEYVHMPPNASEMGVPIHPREWRMDYQKLERALIEMSMRPARDYWNNNQGVSK